MAGKRKVSAEFVAKVYAKTGSVAATARKTGRSYVATARRLNRLGVLNTKTAQSR